MFHLEFRQELQHWVETDRKTAFRILELVEAVLRDPFTGNGRPEPHKGAGERPKHYSPLEASASPFS